MKEIEGKSIKRKRGKAVKDNPKEKHRKPLQWTNTHKEEGDPGSSKRPKSSSFLEKMRARLSGGYFRMMNEKLYACTGDVALNYFKEDSSLFDIYHAGYQEQMSHWLEQPVNIIVNWLQDRSPALVVADFGCGDARLSKSVKNTVFSFDLAAHDPSIIACNMSNTPLDASSVDIAVLCPSLMGTNYSSYLQEAQRLLMPSGWLLVAEVKSRFNPNIGGADPNKFSKADSSKKDVYLAILQGKGETKIEERNRMARAENLLVQATLRSKRKCTLLRREDGLSLSTAKVWPFNVVSGF